MKRTSSFVVLIVGAVMLYASTGEPRSAGISGRSKVGCGGSGCHGTSPSSSATVTLTAPSTIAPGGTTPITVTVSDPNVPTTGINQGGFDLSVTGGQFTVPPFVAQNFSAAEVGHTTAGNNQRSWTVTWSPATLCHFDLFAASNAVNGDGLQSSLDHWNLASASIALAPTADDELPAVPVFNKPISGDVYLGGNIIGQGLPLTLVIGGPVVVEITASDNVGIDHVTVTDSDLTGSSTTLAATTYNPSTNRFATTWNPATPGQHTLTAVAADCNGNENQATFQAFVL